VFTAAELIETLETRYRRRFPLHAERPFGEFPPTWRQWFLSIEARIGAVTGAPADDFVALFAKRPLRMPSKAPAQLGRLQALGRLHRQQWDAAPYEERGLRRFAAVVSILAHVCFVIALFWLAIIAIESAPKKDDAMGETVQVEFIGEGAPEDIGGGPMQGEDESRPPTDTAAVASPDAPAPQASPPTASAATPLPPTARTEPPASDPEAVPQPPQPAPSPAPQPLVVSEPRTPPDEEPMFVLPSPQPRTVQNIPRALTVPELNAPSSEIEMLEPQPPVRALERRQTATRTPNTPELRQRPSEIDMLEPLPDVQARTPAPRTPRPLVRSPDLRSAPSDVVMREPAPAAPAASAQSPVRPAPGTSSGTASRPTTSQANPAARPSAASGGRSAATPGTRPASAPGSGPAAQPRPGGLPSSRRGDDWDDAQRNRPGDSTTGRNTGPGVFNSDGSIRLSSGNGQIGGGLPPGTITEDFEKIDRMGTWLKRPSVDYTPSRLERFFVPHESLLQEWVRRNIREVFVPIPGTRKRIVCKVSLLQAGGGCTIDDPNLQDQEAVARKPPDVPFKPDLQEDQGNLSKP
jgi:hypothetical protein